MRSGGGAKQQGTIGSFSNTSGVTVSIEEGSAAGYLEMRTAQLSALSQVINGEDFALWDDKIRSNVLWIVSTLTAEVHSLVPITLREATQKGAREGFGDAIPRPVLGAVK